MPESGVIVLRLARADGAGTEFFEEFGAGGGFRVAAVGETARQSPFPGAGGVAEHVHQPGVAVSDGQHHYAGLAT